jgi:hypothetical protein
MANLNIPADLTFTGFPDPSDKNYFDVTVKGLNPDTHYGIQFQWLFADGTKSDWSATRDVLSSLITTPGQPDLGVNDVVGGPGYIKVTWSGTAGGSTATDVARVDVYISGAPFDGTKPADSFVASGTKTITAPAGTYIVKLKALRSDGTTSSLFSVTRTITVQGIGQVVETPTLPTGLSVTSIPFGTQVSWDGTYVSSTFKGFQSIVINASTTNVGASVTTEPGIPVAQLSVNNAKNSANIPLGANVGYAFDTFYYYIATNTDGTVYKENGVATWTRINSVGVRPTKANKIDLENGVISIENLVAGNGAFTTYLKAGADTGARVTLSGLTTTTNGVLPGLTIYKSDGTTPAMRADFSGNLSFSGDISGATGTLTNALNVGTAVNGKYPFSVSGSGILNSTAGSIGGFTIDATSLQANNNTFQLDSTNGRLAVGPISGSHIEIDGTSGILHKSSSSASGNFQLTSSGHLTLGSSSGSGNYLEWDGTNLNIRGGLTITSGATYDDIQYSKNNVGGIVTLTDSLATGTGFNNGTGKSLTDLVDFYKSLDRLFTGDYTKVDGGKISTGIIQSTGYVTINQTNVPATTINLNSGEFSIGAGALTFNSNTKEAVLTLNATHDQPFQIKAVAGTSLSATSSTYNWDGTTDSLGGTDADTTIRSVDTSSVSLSATETIGIIQKNTSGSTGPRLLMSTGSGGFTEIGAYGSTFNSSIIFNNGHIIFKSNLSSPYVMQGLGSTTHPSYSYADIPTTLNINAQGTLSRGRAFFRSGNTETNILTGRYSANNNQPVGYSWIGVSGDIIFSTAD